MNIKDLLNIKYPILQGAMANISTHRLVAAVSNAGGLGIIGSGSNDANWVREEIRKTRELTDKPFGVNVLLITPHAKEIAQVVIDEKVPVVTTGAGSPGIYMEGWKEAGIIVIPVVPSVALAVRMERFGADAIIAEGMESGGHIGHTTTLSLIPQVVDAVNIPVIAAGGIADSRGVIATFALGATGVQCGTVFLASEECPIHLNYKEMVIKAKDTSSVITGINTRTQVRVLKSAMSDKYLEMVDRNATIEELEVETLGSLNKAIDDGDLEHGSFMAGQIAGLVNEVKSVKDIIEDIFININEQVRKINI